MHHSYNGRASLLDATPPHSPEAERGLLGSILLDPGKLADVRPIVDPRDFHVPQLRTIFAALLALADDGQAADVPSLVERLRRQGELEAVGGTATLLDVAESMPVATNAVHFARTIREHAVRRRAIDLGLETARRAARGESLVTTLAEAHFGAEQLSAQTAGTDTTRRTVPVVVNLADVAPEAVQWLWPGRIALGKLTMLAGDPGLGKSFLTCDLAARVTISSPWPDDPRTCAPRGGVVMLNCEDDLADTIRPRLDRHGADVERIVAVEAVRDSSRDDRQRQFNLGRDLPALEEAVERLRDCRLVVIDPVTAYLGDRHDSHKAADVRGLLAPLGELAARHRVAVVAVSHLNKGNGAAMYRTMGSLAFVAAARAAWCVSRDRENPERRLFLPIKNNLGNDLTGLAYSLVDGVVAWERDPVTVTADEALRVEPERRGPAPDDRNEAAEFLSTALADGPRPAKELADEAREAHDISRATLRRAKRELRVKAYRPVVPGPWWWCLPCKVLKSSADGTSFKQPESLEHLA